LQTRAAGWAVFGVVQRSMIGKLTDNRVAMPTIACIIVSIGKLIYKAAYG
jgi:hypothetical protein